MKSSRIVFAMALVVLMLSAVKADAYGELKRDNFVILIDQSAEMNMTYKGQSLNYLARDAAEDFIKEIPKEIQVKGAIYMYGIMATETRDRVLTIRNFAPFNKAEFLSSLEEVKKQNGPSTLSIAFNRVRKDMTEKGITGRTAIIVISGGNLTDVGEPTTEFMELKKEHPEVCLFPIMVGTNKRGANFLDELRQKGECGFGTDIDDIDTQPEMANYVEKVFFKRMDAEDVGDASGAIILFDSGSSVIKSQYKEQLDQLASIMKSKPNLRLTIEGHADSDGGDNYNQGLAERRAQAVMKYLANAGVESSRMTAVSRGEEEPVASNDSADGKAQNRRVVFSTNK